MTHRDYDLHDHLARGRKLRSEAFYDLFTWVRSAVRRAAGERQATPAKGARAC